MRLYLDTHILAALLNNEDDKVDKATLAMLTDYANVLYTSPICVNELIHLIQNGRVATGKEWKKDVSVVERIETFGIGVAPLTLAHLKQVKRLPLIARHNDPNDRLFAHYSLALFEKRSL